MGDLLWWRSFKSLFEYDFVLSVATQHIWSQLVWVFEVTALLCKSTAHYPFYYGPFSENIIPALERTITFCSLNITSFTTETMRPLIFVCDEMPTLLDLFSCTLIDKTDALYRHTSKHASDNCIHKILRLLASRERRRHVGAFIEHAIHNALISHVSTSTLCAFFL